MNTIRYVANRDLGECFGRPKLLPEGARNLTMFTAHPVRRTTHPDCQRSKPISLFPISRVGAAKREKLFLTKTKFLNVGISKRASNKRWLELIVSSRYRSVCGKNTTLTHEAHGFPKTPWLRLIQFASEFEREKSG